MGYAWRRDREADTNKMDYTWHRDLESETDKMAGLYLAHLP